MSQSIRDEAHIRSDAQRGVRSGGVDLPYADQIQAAFGPHELSGVRSFIDEDACRRVGADAYALGERVVFARPPDVHTAAHEAAHVVQQRHGVVLRGGVGAPGDIYERNADAVADRVVRGQRVDNLLTAFVGGVPAAAPVTSSGAVQMGVKSFLVKKAVRAIASALRHGGDLVRHIVRHLDDDAARALQRYSRDIADGLDEIANIPDLATRMVREKIYHLMVNELAIDSGTALMIADAIDAALWVLL